LDCRATVIGLGAVGRHVALQLTAMSGARLQLIDSEPVRATTRTRDGYLYEDTDRQRVHATADLCHQLDHGLELYTEARRFGRGITVGDAVFCCVGSIRARRVVWTDVRDRIDFFADVRVTSEALRILVASDPRSEARYEARLRDTRLHRRDLDRKPANICAATIAAGLAVAQFARFAQGQPVPAELHFDLRSLRLSVVGSR
jgi:hypothetical protein